MIKAYFLAVRIMFGCKVGFLKTRMQSGQNLYYDFFRDQIDGHREHVTLFSKNNSRKV